MKRKLLQSLLDTPSDQLEGEIERVLPGDERTCTDARAVLQAIVRKCWKLDIIEPAGAYALLCESTVLELQTYLNGTTAQELSARRLTAVHGVLSELLTSKAGRKKTSTLTRKEQLAEAQQRKRERNADEGRKRLNIWVSPTAAGYLATIQKLHNKDSQGDALELVLEAAMKGEILPIQ